LNNVVELVESDEPDSTPVRGPLGACTKKNWKKHVRSISKDQWKAIGFLAAKKVSDLDSE